PFPPHPQLDVGLTQSRFQFLVLDLELQLTRTAPPSSLLQPLPASIQELLLPVMNRLFRHAVASCRLRHRVLPPAERTAPLAASDRSSSSMASPSPLLRSGPQPRPEQETMTRGREHQSLYETRGSSLTGLVGAIRPLGPRPGRCLRARWSVDAPRPRAGRGWLTGLVGAIRPLGP